MECYSYWMDLRAEIEVIGGAIGLAVALSFVAAAVWSILRAKRKSP